tara:strand:- start:925 stop:1224 length:300 start_codon:yes stop_codon:yes gene_type:complete
MGKHYASAWDIYLIEDRVSAKALRVGRALMADLSDGRETWKYPIKPFKTLDVKLAKEIAEVFDYYLGGSEFKIIPNSSQTSHATYYEVSSHGYYHYIGA